MTETIPKVVPIKITTGEITRGIDVRMIGIKEMIVIMEKEMENTNKN